MKKTLSIILIFMLILAVSISPVFAQENNITLTHDSALINSKDTVSLFYLEKLFEAYPDTREAYSEDNLYYHYIGELDVDTDDAIDFAVIYTHYAMAPDALDGGIISNRFITQPQLYFPFRFGYALFDLEENKFIAFSETITEDYPFVAEFMEQHNIGSPLGDADGDRVLTIIDATHIQRALAQLEEFYYFDDISYYSMSLTYRSDINLDGKRDIMDATQIQCEIAKLNS